VWVRARADALAPASVAPTKRRARGVGRGQEVCDVELISCDGELLIFWSCVGCMVTARGDSDPGAGAGGDHLLASGVRS
jgi:hypothetical protein